MSKIYEALQRAELDRAASDITAPDPEAPRPPFTPPVPTPSVSATAVAGTMAPVQSADALNVSEPHVQNVQGQGMPAASRDVPMQRVTTALASFPAATRSAVVDQHQSAAGLACWTPSFAQLPALEERGSAVEQFRSLRSRMHEFRDLNTLKSILVSSGLPQEGKSYIAANLAISLARHKASRVLLIDGDMRRGTLHKMLGCPCEPGLTEYLSGKATATEVMQHAIPDATGQPLPAGLASLSFIGCGADSEHAADLSGNSRFGALIRTLSPSFDWIVVDSSPVNLVADGVNLARACDGALLIARGGMTKFDVAQRALSELKATRILGFVLNAVENPPSAGAYYGYDSYDKAQV